MKISTFGPPLEQAWRERCYACFRPRSLCFCDSIPQIANRTEILILQHAGERFHPFNTARIVHRALLNSRLMTDYGKQLGSQRLPIRSGAGLLYPHPDARVLSELAAADRPDQLVIIDGTWHQAKTLVRDLPQLHTLPCYRLSPEKPGQYRIRREPNAFSLSTVEASVAALTELEPETEGLDQLLLAFHRMVSDQLQQSVGKSAARFKSNSSTGPRGVPRALLKDPASLVVAYGEAPPGQGRVHTPQPLVNWVAQRLTSQHRFACCLDSCSALSDEVRAHMRLTQSDLETAISTQQFRSRWQEFLHPDDTLIVYHERTLQRLRQIVDHLPEHVVLKALWRNVRTDFQSPEQLLQAEGLPDVSNESDWRAYERLELGKALTERLLTRLGVGPAQST